MPSDGGAKSLRALLDRLDAYSIDAEEFSVHTPDLDDVFLALTGRTTHGGCEMSTKSTRWSCCVATSSTLVRNPTSVFNAVLIPIVMMLMFVYVFGDAFDVGVDYIDYATPGMILLADLLRAGRRPRRR